ncbi:MAG: hypothetical protein M3552_12150 [Planctomycetota bacterium]|nr:hypothetical protein [Planctomycetaceae bacterium]MDQ3331387.1 hypothetical protein [Planctomycetota bacterium]
MRFRDRSTHTPFLNRSDRSRLVRLGIALILIVAAIKVAADPATWVWMFPSERNNDSAAPTLADVSYDVSLDGDDLLAVDEFRSEPIRPIASVPPAVDDGALIDPQVVAAVEDDTLALRRAEREAYFAVLERLRELDERTIEAAADAGATFPAVMTEPAHYRGKAVVIEGTARRILEMPAGANPIGIEHLYELWVFTPDSGDNPWRIVTTELPDTLPRGVLDEGVAVRIAGVFFKRQGYETQAHALHVAPLLLAKTVHRIRPATKAITEFDPAPWLIGTAVVIGLVFTFLLRRFRREDRAFERTTLNRYTKASPDAVAAIPETDAVDPSEFFRKMEEAETHQSEPRP